MAYNKKDVNPKFENRSTFFDNIVSLLYDITVTRMDWKHLKFNPFLNE